MPRDGNVVVVNTKAKLGVAQLHLILSKGFEIKSSGSVVVARQGIEEQHGGHLLVFVHVDGMGLVPPLGLLLVLKYFGGLKIICGFLTSPPGRPK